MNELDSTTRFLIAVIAIIILPCIFVGMVQFFNDFSRELKQLNIEIGRTEGSEREYWIRRKKRLWFSLIPFVKY